MAGADRRNRGVRRTGRRAKPAKHQNLHAAGAASRLKLHHAMRHFPGTNRGNEPYLFKRLAYCRGSKLSRDNPMNSLPVDRALSIYGALADRAETKGARERLSRHLMKMVIEGETDEHRLTVHGLSYLRDLDREIDSRK
jgi:hypothetical protein